MATRRRPISSTHLNFRPAMSDANIQSKGTKPTREATTVTEILTLMILFGCKKILFLERRLKIILYLGCLFGVSIIADVFPVPRWYFSRSDNVINKFFVKFAWAWNLILLIPFVLLTSYIYCCGHKKMIVRRHISRIFIATLFWWFWTKLFNIVEANFGRCTDKGLVSKGTCLHDGHLWYGFDISGHSFILIYGSLMLIEEARCFVNWDGVKDLIRLEEHQRSMGDSAVNSNPLRNLSKEDLFNLRNNYERYTPHIRCLFVLITCMQLVWDFMLLTTALYYHRMVEKLLGGLIAIATWFFTYHVWYRYPNILPASPGEGQFKYQATKETQLNPKKRTTSVNTPTFMGRPIYRPNQEVNVENDSSS